MTWQPGDLFCSTVTGVVYILRKTAGVWTITDAIVADGDAASDCCGSTFDAARNFYVTRFASPGRVVRVPRDFDSATQTPTALVTTGGNNAESLAFLANGDVLVGHAGTTPAVAGANNRVYRYTAAGVLVTDYPVAVEVRGSDWISLAADNDTLFYTSEGGDVLRYLLSTGAQLANLPSGMAECFAIRCLPDGGYVVAGKAVGAKRFSAVGALVTTYTTGAANNFALALGPEATDLWIGDSSTGVIFHYHLDTGALLETIEDPGAPGIGLFGNPVFGLSVFPAATSGPPIVDAGPDQTVLHPATALLDGTVLPGECAGGGVTQLWTKVSGPGTVTFANTALADTAAYFSEGGTYVLRLTAYCTTGGASAFDDLTVTVDGPAATGSPLPGDSMERFIAFSRLNNDGDPAPFATVRVYDMGTPILSDIYASNDLGDPLSNPFTSGEDGLAEFYAPNGRYDVRFSDGGIVTPWAYGDWLLDDPSDVAGVVGPAGPAGAVGPAGAAGPAGPAGASGGVAVGASVYRASDFALAEDTLTAVVLEAVTFDDAVFWSAGQPTRLTVPAGKAGLYLAIGAGCWDSLAVLNSWVYLYVNGVERAGQALPIQNYTPPLVAKNGPVTAILRLAVGDYVELRLFWSYTPALPPFTIKGGAARTYLQLARIGD